MSLSKKQSRAKTHLKIRMEVETLNTTGKFLFLSFNQHPSHFVTQIKASIRNSCINCHLILTIRKQQHFMGLEINSVNETLYIMQDDTEDFLRLSND